MHRIERLLCVTDIVCLLDIFSTVIVVSYRTFTAKIAVTNHCLSYR